MATFPYQPTRILSLPTSGDVIYVFEPSVSASASSQLLALNITGTFNATGLPYSKITQTLPFLDTAPQDSYVPAIDQVGKILVYAGKCGNGTQGSTFWQFTPGTESSNLHGTWKEHNLSTSSITGNNNLDGANYLTSAVAFSSTSNATSEMYIFGGMCPNLTSSEINWTQAANYSNTMLTIQSSQPSSPSPQAYKLGSSSSRGPPVAEAGFSITPLQPTYFNASDGSSTQSQNQNFVLLGGHTQQAFINMSQVALFSLPEQSWTFLPVNMASAPPNTDLTARDPTEVDSRSGHTALLTLDGKSVIVFGGWVGDVTNPAEPQLAVLELGEGYGGSGDWKWSLPSQTGPGLEAGTGLYGHGATMLPGNVMMIVGGYQIPASSGSKTKRANPAMSVTTYFFNTTSSSWITTYTHPMVSASQGTPMGATADSSSVAKKAGLGAGITLGILAVTFLIMVYLWYSRRLKRRRDAREAELRNLAAGAQRFHLSGSSRNDSERQTSEMATVDCTGRPRDIYPWASSNGGQSLSRSSRGEPEAERTGLLFEIPSPTRGLRRSLHSRGTYQPAPRYEDGRRVPGFSTIHPIDERDEYDEDNIDGSPAGQNETIHRGDYNVLSSVPVLDPFRDPVDGSRTPSPQSPQDRELEVRNWVSDWTAADALMHHHVGRISPEKTDRTSSTLSDQSARSGLSSHSIQHSVETISRSISQRSAAVFNSAPFRSTNDTTLLDNQHLQNTVQRYSPEHRRSQSLTLFPSPQRTVTSDVFATAATSFPQLQSEGEALLGDYINSSEQSPTRSQSRTRGWMGSVRRAFTGTDRSASTSPENGDSTSSSPTKHQYTEAGLPRRAASTGTMLWQKRQGARDWEVEDEERRGERSGANFEDGDDEEWDVESAVERRVVQVMFTVPKEKLRVVNKGPDGDGEESILSAEVKEVGEDQGKGKGKEKQ